MEEAAVASVANEAIPGLDMISKLSGGHPVVTIILVAMILLGGKAGWAFWTKRQKLKIELEEKRLELETKVKLAQIKADDDNEECKPKRKRKAKKEQ
jgi:hypothetical protein